MSKDLFSSQASRYAAFRPTYPRALYDFIFSQVNAFDMAWDAGTGNGQVARDLASRFDKVLATDISAKQIENAVRFENITYSVAGEQVPFPEKSFDLICVAQAIHWFDRDRFYAEVKRVAKPGAIIAVWGYGLLSVDSEINVLVRNFYIDVVGPFWDKERKLIDESYQTIAFPFSAIATPPFGFSFQWTLDELQGYLGTWSSVQKYIREKGEDPLIRLITDIKLLWRPPSMKVTFPLFVRLGSV